LFVSKIENDSPAARSQVQEGDIIVSFNGLSVSATHDLFKQLMQRDILDVVDISVIRHSQLLNVTIVPVEREQV
jgi:S1-C subfamily serine protease